MSKSARIAGFLIALIAWVGLLVQLVVLVQQHGSIATALAVMFVFFTITTNLLVAVVFTCVAADFAPASSPSILAGCTLSILLVGILYATLLHGLMELSGGSAVANSLLHQVTPVLVLLFWFVFVPKGRLRGSDPLLWAIYPLGYLVFSVVRGVRKGRFAYPFLNAQEIGWNRFGINALLIATGFLLTAFLTVALDRRLGRSGN